MEIAESTYCIFPGMFFLDFDNTKKTRNYNLPKPIWREINSSSFNSTIFGVPKLFVPRWNRFWWWGHTPKNDIVVGNDVTKNNKDNNNYNFEKTLEELNPSNWTYIYDHSPLKNTLDKYIDYKKLSSTIHKDNNIKRYKDKKIVIIIKIVYSNQKP